MIDERIFTKLLNPIIALQNECTVEILSVFMDKIKEIKTDSKQIPLSIQEHDLLVIGELKNKYMRKTRKKIEVVFYTLADIVYDDCMDLYRYQHRKQTELKDDKDLWRLINEAIATTLLIYNALCNDYYIKLLNQRTAVPITKAYKQTINRAETTKGSDLDFDVFMADFIKSLIESGLKVKDNDRYYSLENSVPNVVSQVMVEVAQSIYTYVGKKLNCDGVEISAHLAPAIDHAPCQGHQFTNQNWKLMQGGQPFVDTDNNLYTAFDRQIGTYNCKHLVKPIIVGVTKQLISNHDLERILEANERGYTTKDGKHYTFYECTQKLNYFKRKMDKSAQGITLSKHADNSGLVDKYNTSYSRYKSMYDTFKEQLDKRLYVNN